MRLGGTASGSFLGRMPAEAEATFGVGEDQETATDKMVCLLRPLAVFRWAAGRCPVRTSSTTAQHGSRRQQASTDP